MLATAPTYTPCAWADVGPVRGWASNLRTLACRPCGRHFRRVVAARRFQRTVREAWIAGVANIRRLSTLTGTLTEGRAMRLDEPWSDPSQIVDTRVAWGLAGLIVGTLFGAAVWPFVEWLVDLTY